MWGIHQSALSLRWPRSQQTVESHPSKYRRLANSQADALPRAAEPYFPVGLAVSADEPLSFNFDLFLYDGLELPAGLFGDDAGGSVSFGNVQEAREYCERYARHARQVVVEPSAEPSARRGRLDKRAMFAESGNSLRELMETGNSACDQNLDRVRRDRWVRGGRSNKTKTRSLSLPIQSLPFQKSDSAQIENEGRFTSSRP